MQGLYFFTLTFDSPFSLPSRYMARFTKFRSERCLPSLRFLLPRVSSDGGSVALLV